MQVPNIALNTPVVLEPPQKEVSTSKGNASNASVEAGNKIAADQGNKSPVGKYIKLPLKIALKPLKWALFNFHNIVVYGLLLGIGAAYTPGAWKAFNSVLQTDAIGLVPRPSNTRSINENSLATPYDNFFENFVSSTETTQAITTAGISPSSIDMNRNGTILDSREEFQELISRLQIARNSSTIQSNQELYTSAINNLNDINILSELIWGPNGPTADNVSQRSEPTCQAMSALRGLFLTPEHTQYTKGLIRVTNYNLDPANFYIDTTVRINGTDIPVSFEELTTSMSPFGYSPSQSNDGSLYTAILSTAIKKSSPDKIPNFWPSTSPILLTDRDYSTVGIMALSDSELRGILSTAPNTLMTVTSTFSLEDMRNGLDYRAQNWISPLQSPDKATEFKTAMASRTQSLIAGSTPQTTQTTSNQPNTTQNTTPAQTTSPPPNLVASSSPPSAPQENNTTNPRPVLSSEYVMKGHVYVVEAYDQDTDTLTISDSHGAKINLTRDEIRERLIAIVLPNEDISVFGGRSLPAYGLVLGAGLLYSLGKRRLKLVLFPKKKTGEIKP